MLSRLFIAALWSPAWKGVTSWLLFVMFNCVFYTFPCGILGQVWYFILSFSDFCRLSLKLLLWVTRVTIENRGTCTVIQIQYTYSKFQKSLYE